MARLAREREDDQQDDDEMAIAVPGLRRFLFRHGLWATLAVVLVVQLILQLKHTNEQLEAAQGLAYRAILRVEDKMDQAKTTMHDVTERRDRNESAVSQLLLQICLGQTDGKRGQEQCMAAFRGSLYDQSGR
jgi:hypothetical protein